MQMKNEIFTSCAALLRVRVLSATETASAIALYAAEHPRAWATVVLRTSITEVTL